MTARFDQLPPDALDASVDWLDAHGVRAHALLAPWELRDFLQRFAGQRVIERFDSRLVFEYAGENTHRFYDLTRVTGQALQIPRADARELRSTAPVASAGLDFR